MTLRMRLLLSAILGLTAGCGGASEFPNTVEFVVGLDRVPPDLREDMLTALPPDDTVRLRLPGRVFDPPRTARIIPKDSIDRSSLLEAVEADLSAFKTQEDRWILETFASADQPDVLDLLADAGVRAASRDMFSRIVSQDVVATAELKTDTARYAFALLKDLPQPGRRVVNTYRWEAGEWRRTNALARHPTSRFLTVAFRAGAIRPIP